MAKLTHLDGAGRARMVDVGKKRSTRRTAFKRLAENRLAKGDALAVARLAGVQAAKRTAEWIPLCHVVPLDHVEVEIDLHEEDRSARVTATASATGRTGVEMEALVAVSAACLALYDMAKAVDRGITIGEIRLMSKQGGRSGRWTRRTTRG
jgi:cyclic pyranopterin phosphate synthase